MGAHMRIQIPINQDTEVEKYLDIRIEDEEILIERVKVDTFYKVTKRKVLFKTWTPVTMWDSEEEFVVIIDNDKYIKYSGSGELKVGNKEELGIQNLP